MTRNGSPAMRNGGSKWVQILSGMSRAVLLQPQARLGDAVRLAAGSALRQLTANLADARRGDPAGVHRMRVGLRRLRAVFVLFDPYLEGQTKARFNRAIRKLGLILGTARDWDVFVLETLGEAKRAGVANKGLSVLRKAAERRRMLAHAKVRRTLNSAAVTGLARGVETWFAKEKWCVDQAQHALLPVAELLPDLLERIARKVDRRGRNLARRSPEDLHRLRKSIKKLRYSAESCERIYKRDRVERAVKCCKKLQSLLGAVNDSAVAARLVKEIAPTPIADLKPDVDALLKWIEARRKTARAKLPKAWREFNAATPFWH